MMYNVSMVNTDDCWLFAGFVDDKGYGHTQVWIDGKWHSKSAHRLMFEALVSEVPKGLCLDHLCRVRRCINPAHLEIVTYRENLVRGDQYMEDKTHCKKGHKFTQETVYRHTNGTRICKVCRREYARKRRELGIWDYGRKPKHASV